MESLGDRMRHCRYLLDSNIHSRIFACTVFSFIAVHFSSYRVFGLSSVFQTVTQRQFEAHTWFREGRLEIYSACEKATLGQLCHPGFSSRRCSVTLDTHTEFSQEPKLNFCSHENEILMLFHVCALRLNLQCKVLETFKCFCTNCKYLSEAF